jgi:hypothetical protein
MSTAAPLTCWDKCSEPDRVSGSSARAVRSVGPTVSALTAAPGGSAEAAQRSQRRANARKQVGRQRELIPERPPGDPHGPLIPVVLSKRLLVPEPVRSHAVRQLDQQCSGNIVPIANLSTRSIATVPLPLQPRAIDYLLSSRIIIGTPRAESRKSAPGVFRSADRPLWPFRMSLGLDVLVAA